MALSDLTPETRELIERVERNKPENKSLQVLQDIAVMCEELIRLADDRGEKSDKLSKELGAVLVDMRESLKNLDKKEAPDTPDYAKPVVERLKQLETALTGALKKIDVRPVVNSPQVNVDAPSVHVDLNGVEKVLKEMPKAFKEAIRLIPKTEIPEDDYSPIISKLSEIGTKLDDIDTGVRMKPQPGSIKINNLGTVEEELRTSNLKYGAFQFDPNDSAPIYIGKHEDVLASNADTDWVIYKFTYSGSNVTDIRKKTGVWNNRSSIF